MISTEKVVALLMPQEQQALQANHDALALLFIREAGPIVGQAWSIVPALGQFLADQWAAGRVAWPFLSISPEDLVCQLAGALRSKEEATWPGRETGEPGVQATIDLSRYGSQAADLYLACACACQHPAAISAFEDHYLRRVPALVPRPRLDGDQLAEVIQRVRLKLFQPPSKLRGYAGQAPLKRWLRTLIRREALALVATRHDRVVEDLLAGPAVHLDLEIRHMRQRCRDEFRAALRLALSALQEEHRAVLRYCALGELTLEQIAKLCRISVSTVQRRLASAQGFIVRETKRHMQQRLRLTPTEVESLVRVVRDVLDDSIAQILTAEKAEN